MAQGTAFALPLPQDGGLGLGQLYDRGREERVQGGRRLFALRLPGLCREPGLEDPRPRDRAGPPQPGQRRGGGRERGRRAPLL